MLAMENQPESRALEEFETWWIDRYGMLSFQLPHEIKEK